MVDLLLPHLSYQGHERWHSAGKVIVRYTPGLPAHSISLRFVLAVICHDVDSDLLKPGVH